MLDRNANVAKTNIVWKMRNSEALVVCGTKEPSRAIENSNGSVVECEAEREWRVASNSEDACDKQRRKCASFGIFAINTGGDNYNRVPLSASPSHLARCAFEDGAAASKTDFDTGRTLAALGSSSLLICSLSE